MLPTPYFSHFASALLARRQKGKRHLYTPKVTIEECVRRESDSFMNRVLGRAPIATLVSLVERADLSKEDIQELRRIMREKEEE